MVPEAVAHEIVDVTAALFEPTIGHDMLDDAFEMAPVGTSGGRTNQPNHATPPTTREGDT